MIRNCFLDRDGTIILEKHYLSDPAGVELIPGAGEGLRSLVRAGVRLFVATNQSGIGRGYYETRDFEACRDRLAELLAAHGVEVEETLYCPHTPEEGCGCRKPETGLFDALARKHGLNPEECAMVGDKIADVSFGLKAGFAASILVRTGHGEKHAAKLGLPPLPESGLQVLEVRRADWPHVQARDLATACSWLLAQAGGKD